MSLPIPLEVRLRNSRMDRVVTADLRDLSFTSVDPGGFASATGSFHHPLILRPDELDYYTAMYVYDRRRGGVVWEGWVEDLGGGAGTDGQIWDFAAVGPSAHVKDRILPYVAVESDLGKLSPTSRNQWEMHWQSGAEDEATGAPAIAVELTNGAWTLSGVVGETMYRLAYDAGMEIARVQVGWDAGFTSLAWQVSIWTWTTPTTGGSFKASASNNTAGGTLLAKLAGDSGTIAATDTAVSLNVTWDGPTNYVSAGSGEKLSWTWDSLHIRVKLYDKSGSKRTSGYTANTVTSDEVVADLLGRGVLNLYDGPGASIATGVYAISQFSYPDGVSADKLLQDLMGLDNGFTWYAWESNSAGKYRFEWTTYPTTVGYEADAGDGYQPESTAADLYNEVLVRYLSTNGKVRPVKRTQTVAQLAAAGRTRTGFIDLGDETAVTVADANQAGDNWLADRKYPTNAGRLRIARPILDVAAGRMVDPWELTRGVGKLIRVAGIQPRIDALNPTGRDGVTVFRVKSVEVSSDGSASLELDVYSRATAQALATYQALTPTQRRRR